MTAVLILLCHGCPLQAIVAAFGLDERTVGAWLRRAGAHCAALHGHLVEGRQVAAGQVQADEIRVKVRGGVVWQAMALDVASRLWRGGAVSPTRDGALVTRLLERGRACVATRAILRCVDGFAAYSGAARTAFRGPRRTGKRAARAWSGRRASCSPRWSRATRGGDWPRSSGAWSSAWRARSRGSSPRRAAARRSTRPTSSGSTPPSAPTWRPWRGGAVPSRTGRP